MTGIMAGLIFGITAFATPCLADSAQEELVAAQQEQAQTMSSLVSVQERIGAIEAKKGQTEAYLEEVNSQISALNEELEAAQRAFSDKQKELDKVNGELVRARKDEEVQHENMAIRIQYMYENSQNSGILEALFSAEGFSDFITRVRNVAELTKFDRKMMEDYEAARVLVEEKQAQAEKEKEETAALREQCREKKEEMQAVCDATKEEIRTLARELEDEESEAAALIGAIQEQEYRISALSVQAAEEVAAAQAAYEAEMAALAQAQMSSESAPAPVAETEGSSDGYVQEEVYDETPESYQQDGGDAYEETSPSASPASTYENTSSWGGSVLTASAGVNQGPSGKETYYNLNMSGVVDIMRNMGNNDEYWVRDDGVKMLGDYVMVAANLDEHPRGSLVESSLGTAIVCDTGGFAYSNPQQLDIATAW